MNRITCRPISTWPGTRTPPGDVRRSPFRAAWSMTSRLLDHELEALDAGSVALELDIQEQDIRLDGWPRAHARPATPGVVLSFQSRYGPLRYACDRFDRWQDNVRAIALGLESLRRVDRYGITKRGEQYTGWRALPPAGGSGLDARARLAEFVRDHGQDVPEDDHALRRRALRLAHPDIGGDPDTFRKLALAAQQLTGEPA